MPLASQHFPPSFRINAQWHPGGSNPISSATKHFHCAQTYSGSMLTVYGVHPGSQRVSDSPRPPRITVGVVFTTKHRSTQRKLREPSAFHRIFPGRRHVDHASRHSHQQIVERPAIDHNNLQLSQAVLTRYIVLRSPVSSTQGEGLQ